MVALRPYRPDDLDALYHICLVTGDAGADASVLHKDGKLLGHLYAAPYGVLEPENAFIAEDEEGVAGYIVGTHDSTRFDARLEREWWPALREHYAGIPRTALTRKDLERIEAIRNPSSNPPGIVARYPAHIHMNLLPRLRGQRVGTRLLEMWIDQARRAGVRGIHLGASTGNRGAVAFWSKSGFEPIEANRHVTWFGMTL